MKLTDRECGEVDEKEERQRAAVAEIELLQPAGESNVAHTGR